MWLLLLDHRVWSERNWTVAWLDEVKDDSWKYNCGTLIWLKYAAVKLLMQSCKIYSLHLLQNPMVQLLPCNKCVDVEHGKKSLDYRPLMNVINQCEAISPLMSMSAKVPKYIMQSANKWVDVEPLARSNDQGTLMYSHDCLWENFSLRHASLKVIKMNSSPYPR